jgi:hypothetical protein
MGSRERQKETYEAHMISRPRRLDQASIALTIKAHHGRHDRILIPLLTMLLRSTLITILTLPVLISGSQIPAVNGVIGGVPAPDARNVKNLARATPPTPGKLRVVENSGVCGEVILFAIHPSGIFTLLERNYARCLSSLGIW